MTLRRAYVKPGVRRGHPMWAPEAEYRVDMHPQRPATPPKHDTLTKKREDHGFAFRVNLSRELL